VRRAASRAFGHRSVEGHRRRMQEITDRLLDAMAAKGRARDPRHFVDPDVFDIGRTPNPHLAQGHGAHFCLGGALGRMQIEVAIGSLLSRFPQLAPAVPVEAIAWRNERFNAGMEEFPVTW